jgi:DNA polymerase-3 subunit beta
MVERFTGNPTTLPAVAGVQLVVKSGKVVVRATNLEEFIEASLPAKAEGEGDVVVPGSVLAQVIGTSREEHITLTLNENDVLSVGRAQLRALHTEEFPTPPSLEQTKERILDGEVLSDLFEAVLPSVATSTIKPELTGVYYSLGEEECVVAATDSFRLAEKRAAVEQGEVMESFILPRRSVASILRLIEQRKDVFLTHDGRLCRVRVDGVVYTTRLIEGSFPDYERIIPTSFATTVVVPKEEFLFLLRRVNIFTDQFSYLRMKVQLEERVIRLFASNQQVGEVEETLPIEEGEGEPQEVGFNLRYLQEGLAPVKGERVLLRFVGGNRPLVITGKEDTSYRYLVMPMNR